MQQYGRYTHWEDVLDWWCNGGLFCNDQDWSSWYPLPPLSIHPLTTPTQSRRTARPTACVCESYNARSVSYSWPWDVPCVLWSEYRKWVSFLRQGAGHPLWKYSSGMSTGIFVDRVYDVKNTDLTGTQRMEKCNELQKFGVDPSVLGTHSLRKGSASYTTSGSTAGPSFSAICQRAGWKLGTVQDR